jgi:hypothetical protein
MLPLLSWQEMWHRIYQLYHPSYHRLFLAVVVVVVEAEGRDSLHLWFRMYRKPGALKVTRRLARRLCGLVYWVKDKIRRGIQINPYEFDEAALIEALQEDEGEELADTVEAELPQKFTADRWIAWEIELSNYLSTKKGIRGIPLAYIIRPELKPDEIIAAEDITKQEIYAAPLEGATFRRDNNKVWGILRGCTMGTPAWEWIKQLESKADARLGMQKLRLHWRESVKPKMILNEPTIKGKEVFRSKNM